MSRIYDIVQGLINGVRSLTPQSSPDLPFLCAEDAQGAIQSPGDWMLEPRRRTREFDVRSTSFARPGPGCNLLLDCAIRVVYQLDQDLGMLDVMVQEDAQTIINGVMFSTTWWGTNANSVFVPEGEAPTAEVVENENGAGATMLLSIPITIDYRREP
jgi:hypothetical protein